MFYEIFNEEKLLSTENKRKKLLVLELLPRKMTRVEGNQISRLQYESIVLKNQKTQQNKLIRIISSSFNDEG